MDWQKNPIFVEMGLDALPSGYGMDAFHHSNTSFPFILGPNPYKDAFGKKPNYMEDLIKARQSNQNVTFKGNNFGSWQGTAETQVNNPLTGKYSKQQSPRDESWDSIESVTETSVTSSDGPLTESSEDDRPLSQLRSSDFVSMGDTYSASAETTDDDTLESDDTVNSQFDTEASELTDYEDTKNRLSNESRKKTMDAPKNERNKVSTKKAMETLKNKLSKDSSKMKEGQKSSKMNSKKSSKKHKSQIESRIINEKEYVTNDSSLFDELDPKHFK